MWLTGVFGIATRYAEAVLAVKYRVTTAKGAMAGGPMYVLERGMKARWLGVIFAALTAVAAFGSLIALAGVAAAGTDHYLWTGDLEDSGEAPRPFSSAAP
jgi:Na+/alanine symporter